MGIDTCHGQGGVGWVWHPATSAVKAVVETSRDWARVGDGSSRRRRGSAKGNLALGAISCSRLYIAAIHAASIVLLNLGLEAAAVGCVSDASEVRSDGLNQHHLLGLGGMLQRRLDDVVAKVVTQKTIHLAGTKKFINHQVLRVLVTATEALLDHIGAELVSGELTDSAAELLNQRLRKGSVVQINYILNHIVAKRILHKACGVLGDFGNQPHLLIPRGVVDAALENAATMTMSADIDASVTNCSEDELSTLGVELVETLLDHMVTVNVLDQLYNSAAQCLDD